MADTVPTSAYETDIIAAIRAGLTLLELLACGPWTRAELDATMRRHHLAETSDGHIAPRHEESRGDV